VDFFGEYFTESTAEDGEILAEDKHLATINGSPSCDYAVCIRTFFEPGGLCPMSGKQVKLVEAAMV
jgi:hypothetical protein